MLTILLQNLMPQFSTANGTGDPKGRAFRDVVLGERGSERDHAFVEAATRMRPGSRQAQPGKASRAKTAAILTARLQGHWIKSRMTLADRLSVPLR
jgi:hypothetical protein